MEIEDIPTDTFNQIIWDLIAAGWKKTYEYDGFDAWIDYGRIVLKKGSHELDFEWTNWFEGSLKGQDSVVESIRSKYQL